MGFSPLCKDDSRACRFVPPGLTFWPANPRLGLLPPSVLRNGTFAARFGSSRQGNGGTFDRQTGCRLPHARRSLRRRHNGSPGRAMRRAGSCSASSVISPPWPPSTRMRSRSTARTRCARCSRIRSATFSCLRSRPALLCFALWREAQCFLDSDGCGGDLKGLSRRVTYGAAGLFYAVFASVAFSMMIGAGRQDTDDTVRDWTAWLLGKPMGPWLLGAVGLVDYRGGASASASPAFAPSSKIGSTLDRQAAPGWSRRSACLGSSDPRARVLDHRRVPDLRRDRLQRA